MAQKHYTAICFDANNKPYKYRHIDTEKLASFEKFARTAKYNKPEIIYINYYDSKTKKFVFQVNFNK